MIHIFSLFLAITYHVVPGSVVAWKDAEDKRSFDPKISWLWSPTTVCFDCVSTVITTACFELWSPTTLCVSREGDHLSDDRFIVWPKPLTSPLSLNSLNFLSHSNVNYCLPVLWLSCTGVGGWGNKNYLFKLFILSGDPNVSGMTQFLIVNVFSRDFELIGW